MKKLISILLSLVLLFSLSSVSLAAEKEKPFENSNYYTDGEYTLHYRVFEPEAKAKKQILLIHGFCLSTVSLEALAKEYREKGYRVVLVDVPNFGYSTRESSDMLLLSREELIGSLMAFLGGKWIVGGHSMGGGIAINLACDYPDTVTGLVLFAPQTSQHTEGRAQNPLVNMLLGRVYSLVLGICLKLPFLVRMFVSSSFSDSEYAKGYDLERITKPLSLEGTATGIAMMTTHTRGTDFEKLKALDIPCIILTAENDKIASGENLQRIIDNAPEGTLIHKFTKGGHMMMEYLPKEASEITLPIIEKA